MRSLIYAVGLLGLLIGMGAVADKLAAENAALVTPAAADPETTGSIGPSALPLSGEERGRIFDYVVHMPDAPAADVPAPQSAAPLPRSVPLKDLPAGAVREIPQVQG